MPIYHDQEKGRGRWGKSIKTQNRPPLTSISFESRRLTFYLRQIFSQGVFFLFQSLFSLSNFLSLSIQPSFKLSLIERKGRRRKRKRRKGELTLERRFSVLVKSVSKVSRCVKILRDWIFRQKVFSKS